MLAGNIIFPVYNPTFESFLERCTGCSDASQSLPERCFICGANPARSWLLGLYKNQEGGGTKVFWVSVANGLVHSGVLIFLSHAFTRLDLHLIDPTANPRSYFELFAAEMIVVGEVIAAELFGIYLYASSRWLNINQNDAYSSMRRNSHRHFVRIRILDNELTLFPIALDTIPKRQQWRLNDKKTGSPAPAFYRQNR